VHNAKAYTKKGICPHIFRAACREEKLDAVSKFISELSGNPFGAKVRISLFESEASGRLGTYGFIRAPILSCACVKKGEKDLEGLGYEFEEAVLYATSLGLGTCW
jgi:nitroreductase